MWSLSGSRGILASRCETQPNGTIIPGMIGITGSIVLGSKWGGSRFTALLALVGKLKDSAFYPLFSLSVIEGAFDYGSTGLYVGSPVRVFGLTGLLVVLVMTSDG